MFWRTVMYGNNAMSWKTMAMSRFCGGWVVTSVPPNQMRPAVGVSRPAIIRRVVVLPQPEAPTKVKSSRSPISRERSRTACTARAPRPKRLSRCSSRTEIAMRDSLARGPQAAQQVTLQEEDEQKCGHRDEYRRGHHHAPVHAGLLHEGGEADGQREHVAVRLQEEGEGEVVPGECEGEDGHGKNARPGR